VNVALGSDHAGYRLKERLKETLRALDVRVLDLGTHDEASVDYVDFGLGVGDAVRTGAADRGIAICGTGIGVSIAANKVPGVRAALCHDPYTARLGREHNDANVLCLGARITGEAMAAEIVRVFLDAPFAGGRHARRVDRLAAVERDLNRRQDAESRPMTPRPAGPGGETTGG
jgi:ribose 5-phosphate isomerase B